MNDEEEMIDRLRTTLILMAEAFEARPHLKRLYPMAYRGVMEAVRIMALREEKTVWN